MRSVDRGNGASKAVCTALLNLGTREGESVLGSSRVQHRTRLSDGHTPPGHMPSTSQALVKHDTGCVTQLLPQM